MSSCLKENAIGFTSDLPNDFKTNIDISYYESQNTTTVLAYFMDPTDPSEWRRLQLPSNSHLKVNGIELSWHPESQYYQLDFEGKPDGLIEFKNHDETVYNYALIPPDTAYFINLPDTLPSLQDFELQINAPLLDSNEHDRICLDVANGDNNNCMYSGTDSIINLESQYFQPEKSHIIFLYRTKNLQNPNLPLGGGGITYNYIVDQPLFSQ